MPASLGINLASQPFRRERAQNAVYVLICAALTCSLIALIILMIHERAEAADLRQNIDRQRAELRRLNREGAEFSNVLSRPANSDVFSRNVFLNQLIARRGVSWTRVFEDLSVVLPPNVRLMAIRLPQVSALDSAGVNRVQLDMSVGADRPEALIDLLKRLEKSSLFGSAAVISQAPPTQNDPLYKFRVTVAYAQKL